MNQAARDPSLEKIVQEFLAGNPARNNPRSTTGVWRLAETAYHLKTSENDLSGEAELLRQAGEKVRGDSVRAVPFVHYDAKANVLVTRYVEGENLFNKIWNAGSVIRPGGKTFPSLAETAGNLGRWLKRFHELHRSPSAGEKAVSQRKKWLMKNMAEKSAGIAHYGAGILSKEELGRISGAAERLMEDPSWLDAPLATVHGDFSPSNIVHTRGGVCYVSDFGNAHDGIAWEDAARFWSGLWEISRASGRRKRQLSPAMDAFLTAYGLDPAALNSPVWNVLRLNNSLIRVHMYVKPGFRVPWRLGGILRRLSVVHLEWLRAL